MNRIQLLLLATLGSTTLAWVATERPWHGPHDAERFTEAFLQLTGVLAIAAMSVAMVLANRVRRFERPLGGLDKGYQLHKWLGISAALLASMHWLGSELPDWLGADDGDDHEDRASTALVGAERLLDELMGPAHLVGELAFYAVIVLVVIALLKKVPYHWFARTHVLMSLVYLSLAFHGALLLERSYWTGPLGPLVAAFLGAGSLSAVVHLTRQTGRPARAKGTITHIARLPKLDAVTVTVRLTTPWPGHRAGQFAFVRFGDSEAHPFTIRSAWAPEPGVLLFTIKALGDHTRAFGESLAPGMSVGLEGPYGRFTFDAGPRQIWIGGGVGITPFLGRLEELAASPTAAPIDFFYSARSLDRTLHERLEELAEQAGVTLHLRVGRREPRLTGTVVRLTVPRWREASVWFCGPSSMGKALWKDFVANGLPSRAFHRERFEMR